MKIESIQKVIKVGSSLAVTIPARDAKFYALKPGEEVEIRLKRPAKDVLESQASEVVALTQKLISRHKKALENLSQR